MKITRLIGEINHFNPSDSGEITLGYALGIPSETKINNALGYMGIKTPESQSPHGVHLEELRGMHWHKTSSVILDATGVRFVPLNQETN